MRLPYVPDPPELSDAADQAIVERVKRRRGSAGLLELDRALLHSPPVADGWNSFLGSIRSKTTISDSIRETAICRVAVLNRAWYEWEQHVPLLRASGVSEEYVQHILHLPPKETGPLKQEQYAVVLLCTDCMTLDVNVPEHVSQNLKRIFSDREIVEITATIAAYNCVSRFLVALDVGERNGQNPVVEQLPERE